MTPDERALLTKFFADLDQAKGVSKDAEADALIRQGLATNPDAAYLLVQHALLADQALHTAQARIAQLQQQVNAGNANSASGSFLNPGSSTFARSPAPAAAPMIQQPSAFSGGGGLGSFLRSAGTLAAGVAGGQLLYSGLTGLFDGHENTDAQAAERPPEDVTINNYGPPDADAPPFADQGLNSGGFDDSIFDFNN